MRRFMVWATVMAWLLQGGVKSRAEVVTNLQFGNGSTPQYQGAAVVGASTDRWNLVQSLPGSTARSLNNTAGTSSGLTLTSTTVGTASGFWNGNPGSWGTYGNLMSGYLIGKATSDNGTKLTVSGLNSSTVYDVYIYSQVNDVNYNQFFSLSAQINGGATQAIQGNSTNYLLNTFVQNRNYLKFSGITGSTTMDIDYWRSTNSPEGVINGIQIYAVVPEPGTLLLGGIAAACGGTGVWWKRRKKTPADQPAEEPTA
jgi:hypothetical protein